LKIYFYHLFPKGGAKKPKVYFAVLFPKVYFGSTSLLKKENKTLDPPLKKADFPKGSVVKRV